MLIKIKTAAISGIEARLVEVETETGRGLPSMNVAGLGDATIKEAGLRIRSAIGASGKKYPSGRITINLAPAWMRKRGSQFDLPMAIGILAASKELKFRDERIFTHMAMVGELSLDGTINGVKGVIPMIIALGESGVNTVIVPSENFDEARIVPGIEIISASHLSDVMEYVETGVIPEPKAETGGEDKAKFGIKGMGDFDDGVEAWDKDYSDIKGQEGAKRALVVAAAGGHGLLMVGSPGTGKTMLAERLPGILPALPGDEALELAGLYSVAGEVPAGGWGSSRPPFRSPGTGLSVAGLIGTGVPPRPGEATLAHRGVLFLDELGERKREVIDSLRIPLEEKKIRIMRHGISYEYPADFLFISASNPCKCGYFGDPKHPCNCTSSEIAKYKTKLSGPMAARIDMHIHLTAPKYVDLVNGEKTMRTSEMRENVMAARETQKKRYKNEIYKTNGELSSRGIKKYCRFEDDALDLLEEAYETLMLDPRILDKIKKISRTVADLDGAELIASRHVAEALQYRKRTGI